MADEGQRVYISEWPVLSPCIDRDPIATEEASMSIPKFSFKKARLLPALQLGDGCRARKKLSENVENKVPQLVNKDVNFHDNSGCSSPCCCQSCDGHYETADVALAKWWRAVGSTADKLPTSTERCSGCSASTVIMRIARYVHMSTICIDVVEGFGKDGRPTDGWMDYLFSCTRRLERQRSKTKE